VTGVKIPNVAFYKAKVFKYFQGSNVVTVASSQIIQSYDFMAFIYQILYQIAAYKARSTSN
jgi:hypothetical protein